MPVDRSSDEHWPLLRTAAQELGVSVKTVQVWGYLECLWLGGRKLRCRKAEHPDSRGHIMKQVECHPDDLRQIVSAMKKARRLVGPKSAWATVSQAATESGVHDQAIRAACMGRSSIYKGRRLKHCRELVITGRRSVRCLLVNRAALARFASRWKTSLAALRGKWLLGEEVDAGPFFFRWGTCCHWAKRPCVWLGGEKLKSDVVLITGPSGKKVRRQVFYRPNLDKIQRVQAAASERGELKVDGVTIEEAAIELDVVRGTIFVYIREGCPWLAGGRKLLLTVKARRLDSRDRFLERIIIPLSELDLVKKGRLDGRRKAMEVNAAGLSRREIRQNAKYGWSYPTLTKWATQGSPWLGGQKLARFDDDRPAITGTRLGIPQYVYPIGQLDEIARRKRQVAELARATGRSVGTVMAMIQAGEENAPWNGAKRVQTPPAPPPAGAGKEKSRSAQRSSVAGTGKQAGGRPKDDRVEAMEKVTADMPDATHKARAVEFNRRYAHHMKSDDWLRATGEWSKQIRANMMRRARQDRN